METRHNAGSPALPAHPAFTRADFAIFAAIGIGYPGDLQTGCARAGGDAEKLIYPAIQEVIRRWIDGWEPPEGASTSNEAGHVVRPGTRATAVTVISWSLFGCAYRWSRGKRDRPVQRLPAEAVRVGRPLGARVR